MSSPQISFVTLMLAIPLQSLITDPVYAQDAGFTIALDGDLFAGDPAPPAVAVERVRPHPVVGPRSDDVIAETSPLDEPLLEIEVVPTTFWVGHIDLTFGHILSDDEGRAVVGRSNSFSNGRAAGYFSTRFANGTQITASIDTGEGPIKDAFHRLNERDPRRYLDRLDTDDVYLTYGDDSFAYDDAPTSGRFYLRIERGSSHFIWGDFDAELAPNSRFLAANRRLYGAKVQLETGAERHPVSLNLYAATPDTLPQRDTFLGTGGSTYFLTRQDISRATETLQIETRDKATGRLIASRRLAEGADYDIDYIQGVVILSAPLNSANSDGALIRAAPLGDYDVNLVAQYEFTPSQTRLEGASVGARLDLRPTENLTLGFTFASDSTGLADQRVSGADLSYQIAPGSHFYAEIAESEGPGFGASLSTNGGLTIEQQASAGLPAKAAQAVSLKLDLDLADFGSKNPGSISFYHESKEAGFSTFQENIRDTVTLTGFHGATALNDRTQLRFQLEHYKRGSQESRKEAQVSLEHKIGDRATVEYGFATLDQTTPNQPTKTGQRADFALRFTVVQSERLTWIVFGQKTVNRAGGLTANDRLGLGIDTQLSERFSLQTEVSNGSTGLAATARLTYRLENQNEFYFGYTLDPLRAAPGNTLVGRDRGTFVYGARRHINDRTFAAVEHTIDRFGERHSKTKTYKLTFSPRDTWTFSGGFEHGAISDPVSGDFDRTAVSFGMTFSEPDRIQASIRLEYRTEDGVGLVQDRETWALNASFEYHTSDDWRLVGSLDGLVSNSAASTVRDGEYLELSFGYAYRPTDSDRTNAFYRLTYLHDLPGPDQIGADGTSHGPLQRSLILSVDVEQEISDRWTLGAKYGLRIGEVADRTTRTFTRSTAHLGILRADFHAIGQWDIGAETRILFTEETNTVETGVLIGVYHHLNDTIKVGVGYEWGSVSSDLTDFTHTGDRIFVNIAAKF